jgi:hypothetical protein
MSLDDPANLVYLVGHQGPHPMEYHQEVYESLAHGAVPVRAAVHRQVAARGVNPMPGPSTRKPAVKKPPARKTSAKRAAPEKTAKASGKAAAGAPAAEVPKAREAGAASALSASRRIDQRIAELKDWRGERLAELRRLIHEVDPEVVEDWKWMGTPVWSNNGMYALANPHRDKVKLTFHHGAQLPDPRGLFNAGLGGGKWRAIDFHEGDELDRPALAALLRAAVEYNRSHSVPRSRGSRLAKEACE